jgi:hypothetical protein
MADDEEFDDDENAEIEEDADLDEEIDIDGGDEADDTADVVDDADLLADAEPVEVADAPAAGAAAPAEEGGGDDEDDDVVDLEEELHPDDVEEPLDVLLHERTKADRLEEEANDLEDDDLEPDEKGDVSTRVVPRRDDEFLCRSCFLVKPLSQLARGEKDLCRDCE